MDFLFQIFTESWKLWVVVSIALMIGEGFAAGTFAIFFGGVGALITALVCYFFPSVAESGTQQLMIFSSMSLFSLVLLRQKILRLIHKETRLDGPKAFLGRQGKALTDLNRNSKTGKILFDGTEWSAAPAADSPDIPAGSAVEIMQMEGLTFQVRLANNEHK